MSGVAQSDSAEFIRQVNAQLRYYMHITDPEKLTDREWAERWADLIWIREEEKKHSQINTQSNTQNG